MSLQTEIQQGSWTESELRPAILADKNFDDGNRKLRRLLDEFSSAHTLFIDLDTLLRVHQRRIGRRARERKFGITDKIQNSGKTHMKIHANKINQQPRKRKQNFESRRKNCTFNTMSFHAVGQRRVGEALQS
jgi:hypothetical protein